MKRIQEFSKNFFGSRAWEHLKVYFRTSQDFWQCLSYYPTYSITRSYHEIPLCTHTVTKRYLRNVQPKIFQYTAYFWSFLKISFLIATFLANWNTCLLKCGLRVIFIFRHTGGILYILIKTVKTFVNRSFLVHFQSRGHQLNQKIFFKEYEKLAIILFIFHFYFLLFTFFETFKKFLVAGAKFFLKNKNKDEKCCTF